ncbi:YybH family protein [Luteimonas mephitis]|uniref:YybH family protein n=1 Tax=Luteimonas mephitis TaxID=83615 RepID=UPI0004072E4F|nr:nuclear transport factor 2 family protein [Luteimonas mephitis]
MHRIRQRSAVGGFRWLPVLGIVLAVLALATGCRRESAEQALRQDVAAFQAAIESRDAGGMAAFLAADFVGNDGLDRDGARRLAALYFMRNARIGITSGPLDIQLQDDHATVHTTVVLTGGSGGLLPETGRAHAVTSGWRRERGQWRMTSLSWNAP